MAAQQSYEDRYAAASKTFAQFSPGVESERVRDGFVRRQGALGAYAFDAVGAMWARPQLGYRDRSLLVVSTLMAQGRDEELIAHTRIGLRNGLTQREIEEILLHVAAYAGYPAAMAANRRIDAAFRDVDGVEKLPDRRDVVHKSDADRDRDAAAVFKTITNGRTSGDPAADLALLEGMIGDVGVWVYRWIFGEIWARPELSRRDRSIAVISIITTLGATAELAVHAPAGIAHGLTRVEIEEIVTHLTLYVGAPRAVEAMRAVREALKDL